MSELKRWDVKTYDNYQESDSGFWVKYDDVKNINKNDIQSRIEEARYIAYKSPELNMDNFVISDVEELNNAMHEVFQMLDILVEDIRD